MAKAYSLASWNVEHFRNPDSRVDRVVDFLVDLGPPDVFALYEVEGKEVFDALVSKMPGYTFHITEGPQVQEIMLGVKSSLTAFFTQKTEFKSGLWALRPGALLTLTIAGEPYPILFLHTKSGVEPLGLGLRDDMLNRALDFKKVLEKTAQGPVHYLFLGDLNTMGIRRPYDRESRSPLRAGGPSSGSHTLRHGMATTRDGAQRSAPVLGSLPTVAPASGASSTARTALN